MSLCDTDGSNIIRRLLDYISVDNDVLGGLDVSVVLVGGCVHDVVDAWQLVNNFSGVFMVIWLAVDLLGDVLIGVKLGVFCNILRMEVGWFLVVIDILLLLLN